VVRGTHFAAQRAEDMVEGVVISITEITISKKLEGELRAKEARLRVMLDGKR
jgi:hypothetical protein